MGKAGELVLGQRSLSFLKREMLARQACSRRTSGTLPHSSAMTNCQPFSWTEHFPTYRATTATGSTYTLTATSQRQTLVQCSQWFTQKTLTQARQLTTCS